MIKSIYKAGDIFGYLMLTGKSYINKLQRKVEVICECGTIKWINFSDIKSGHSRSCGCKSKLSRQTHGLCTHALYKLYTDMKQRCSNPNYKCYPNYGGRGIYVCDEWVNNFEAFVNWAENNGWYKGCKLLLDRIGNNKEYSPENCKWSTRGEQNRNKRNNVFVTAFGETKCLMDWINDKRCKISFSQIMYRINKMNWNAEKAITTPSLSR